MSYGDYGDYGDYGHRRRCHDDYYCYDYGYCYDWDFFRGGYGRRGRRRVLTPPGRGMDSAPLT